MAKTYNYCDHCRGETQAPLRTINDAYTSGSAEVCSSCYRAHTRAVNHYEATGDSSWDGSGRRPSTKGKSNGRQWD